MERLLEKIKDIVVGGRFREIEAQLEEAIQGGVDLHSLINQAMIAAMDVVGDRFAKGKIFVPEMLVSAKTMEMGLEILQPLLKEDESLSRGSVLLCTVKGDVHDIGKNLVGMMLEGAGFRVTDLGVDQTLETVLEKIDEIRPDILGLSALLTTTMPEMQKVIEELNAHGLRDRVSVMIGGAPIGAKFARHIGADAYGKDAAEAVAIARSLTASQ